MYPEKVDIFTVTPVSNNIDDWLLDLFVQEYGTSIYTNEMRDPARPSFPVGISYIRRRLSSSVGTFYLRRTESGRPNLTLPLARKIQRRRREGDDQDVAQQQQQRKRQ